MTVFKFTDKPGLCRHGRYYSQETMDEIAQTIRGNMIKSPMLVSLDTEIIGKATKLLVEKTETGKEYRIDVDLNKDISIENPIVSFSLQANLQNGTNVVYPRNIQLKLIEEKDSDFCLYGLNHLKLVSELINLGFSYKVDHGYISCAKDVLNENLIIEFSVSSIHVAINGKNSFELFDGNLISESDISEWGKYVILDRYPTVDDIFLAMSICRAWDYIEKPIKSEIFG